MNSKQIPNTEYHKKLRASFRTFTYLVHQHLSLPDPTPVQLDMCKFLEFGPKRSCIQAFRGSGKSHFTSMYVVWRLLKNPEDKILVVSASKERADSFSTFTQRLIAELVGLEYLRPDNSQRNSKIAFDVGPAMASHSPSVKSVGITGQLTGSRADLIIADDIEVVNNSATQQMRDKLSEQVKEFDAVLRPEDGSRILYLGTPQTQDSLYSKLPDRGFVTRVWPVRKPSSTEEEKYGDTLAPFIKALNDPVGSTVEPLRFDEQDLIEREASYGKAGFALQFMLSTQLSDNERYPLKVRDLLVMPIDNDTAPLRLTWGPSEEKAYKELPNVAMKGDRLYPPMNVGEVFSEFTGCVMSIDPSGRGADETGYSVVKMLNGYLFVVANGGLSGGYDDQTLIELAHIAKKHKVNMVITESNMGDGMFTKLLTPVFNKIHPCAIEEVRHSAQKEKRIIDTLEPVMMSHKLVIDPSVIEEDYRTAQKYEQSKRLQKMLIYQMTRLTADRGALRHDDRLDALSMAVAYYVENMGHDAERGERLEKEEALDRELRKFLDHAVDPFSNTRGTSSYNWM